MVRKDKQKTLEYNKEYSRVYYQKMKELLKKSREKQPIETNEEPVLEKESLDSFSHIHKSSNDDLFIEEIKEPEPEPEEEFKKQIRTIKTKLEEKIKMITIRYGDNEYKVNKEVYIKNPDKVIRQIKQLDKNDD